MTVPGRVLLALLLVTVFASAACAEESQRLLFGPKLGATVSTMSFAAQDFSTSWRAGVTGGGFGEIGLNDYLSVQAELLYVMNGTDAAYKAQTSYTYSLTYHCLELPVLLKLRKTLESFEAFVFAGPALSMLISISDEETVEGWTGSKFKPEISMYDRVDVGVAAGLGGGFRLGDGLLTFDVRYLHGLREHEYAFDVTQLWGQFVKGQRMILEGRHQVISLMAGYGF